MCHTIAADSSNPTSTLMIITPWDAGIYSSRHSRQLPIGLRTFRVNLLQHSRPSISECLFRCLGDNGEWHMNKHITSKFGSKPPDRWEKFIQDAIILLAQGSDGTGDVIFMGVWDSWAHCGAATPCLPHLCCPLLLFLPPVSWPVNQCTLTRWRLTSLHPDLDVVTTKSSNISVQGWESMNSIFTWGGDSAYSCAKFTPKFHLHDLFIPLLGIDFAQPIEDGVIAGRSREVWQ